MGIICQLFELSSIKNIMWIQFTYHPGYIYLCVSVSFSNTTGALKCLDRYFLSEFFFILFNLNPEIPLMGSMLFLSSADFFFKIVFK